MSLCIRVSIKTGLILCILIHVVGSWNISWQKEGTGYETEGSKDLCITDTLSVIFCRNSSVKE